MRKKDKTKNNPTAKIKKRIARRARISMLTRISFLPSVFTTFNLFLGYLALFEIIRGKYITAAYLITACVILDGFDGTIARLTKTESKFGFQLDSLVDGVTFGLVTSILIYFWGFQEGYAQTGKIVAFIFLSSVIIRLARFNVFREAKVYPENIFIGLPCPLAALSIVSVVLVFNENPSTKIAITSFTVYSLVMSFLMISNIKYRTMKKIIIKNSLKTLFLLAIIIASLIMYPSYTIPVITGIYILSPGYFYFISKRKRKKEKLFERRLKEVKDSINVNEE